ncbi:Mu transposase C-terminal domain-containing protein, partial [Acetobacter orleanensis]
QKRSSVTFQTGSNAFARLANISPQAARAIARKALSGAAWRGKTLSVAVTTGKGGSSGKRYLIDRTSLPEEINSTLIVDNNSLKSPSIDTNHRLTLVLRIMASGKRGSAERAQCIREIARKFPKSHDRQSSGVSERTLRGWVSSYEKEGLCGLHRGHRADRGSSRVVAWRAWDRAMTEAGVCQEDQQKIAKELDRFVRSYWAHGASSVYKIQMLMQPRCQDIATRTGIASDSSILKQICWVPKNFVDKKERKRARLIHTKKHDAGGYASNAEPRITRTRDGLLPMDMVAADVRHCDFLISRQDGSHTTAKMIAFLDLATNRIFVRSFICPKGEAIRREHVLETLRDMFADPNWGVPKNLYFDNGGEFQLGEAANDLARLASLVRSAGKDMAIKVTSSLSAGIVRSRAYNPQSKVIEGVFSNFTRTIEPMLKGFIGGQRMNKKVENQGKAPVPMPGDAASIHRNIQLAVAFYNATPQQKGEIAGYSPDGRMQHFVAEDWRSIILDPGEVELAFGPEETRVIKTGGIVSINGRRYHHDAMAQMVGEKQRFRVPFMGNGTRIIGLDDKDNPLLVAVEETAYAMTDRAGAIEQSRRSRALKKDIHAISSDLEPIDLMGEMARFVDANPAPRPVTPEAEITISPVLKEAARQPKLAAPAKLSDNEEFRRTQAEAYKKLNASPMRRRA